MTDTKTSGNSENLTQINNKSPLVEIEFQDLRFVIKGEYVSYLTNTIYLLAS